MRSSASRGSLGTHMARLAIILIGFAAVLAACGGGGSTSSTRAAGGAAAVTTAGYIARADQICQVFKDKRRALQSQANEAVTRSSSNLATARLVAAQRLSLLVRKLQSIDRTATAQLRAIPVPPGDSGVLTGWIAAHQTEVVAEGNVASDLARQTRTSVLQQHVAALDSDVAALRSNESKQAAIARAYGFKVCDSA